MAFDNTMTEFEMDPKTQRLVQSLRGEGPDADLDLDVDGMTPTLLSRFLGLFSRGK